MTEDKTACSPALSMTLNKTKSLCNRSAYSCETGRQRDVIKGERGEKEGKGSMYNLIVPTLILEQSL